MMHIDVNTGSGHHSRDLSDLFGEAREIEVNFFLCGICHGNLPILSMVK